MCVATAVIFHTLCCQRHCSEVSGKVEQLGEMLAQRLGQNVEEGGFAIDCFGRAQLWERKERLRLMQM